MKKELQVLLLACFFGTIPNLAIADDDALVLDETPPPNVDVPDNLGTAGITLEGFYLRGFNSDLVYAVSPLFLVSGTNTIRQLSQDYAFGARLAVDYVGPDSYNILKLEYEHLPQSHGSESFFDGVTHFHASVESTYRAFSATSEQPLLIGPYWETHFIGGARYIQVSQTFSPRGAFFLPEFSASTISAARYEVQFSGGGIVGGLSSLWTYHGFGIGTEALTSILLVNNRLNNSFAIDQNITPILYNVVVNIDDIMNIVPELHVRGFMNYRYKFRNDTEFTTELGYRFNQFFNVRTNHVFENIDSQHIGFAGPYLQFRYAGVI